MSEVTIMNVLQKGISVAVVVAGPILIISLLVGLLISIFQATTQIQEQTLTFVPKLLAIVVVLMFGGLWMLDKIKILTIELLSMIANITR